MVLLGLSILIASISFLCYRHPPSTWSRRQWQWLRRPSPSLEQAKAKAKTQQGDALTATVTAHDVPASAAASSSRQVKVESNIPAPDIDLDSKAMPPPPPPAAAAARERQKKPSATPSSPPAIPQAVATSLESPTTPTAPSFIFGVEDDADSLPPPSFPAANSAQRASTGTGILGPPRLNPIPAFTETTPSVSNMMPPPPRRSPLPLPNRTPGGGAASTSLAVPFTHTTIPAKPRRKVLLTPGHSPLDWARLSSSPSANLRGLPPSTPFLRVPPSLLKQYNGRKGKDAWTVLGGRVYNITPYLPYHPGGGPELMRAAGRDGSKLFGEVHPWVNWEGMLEGCMVGIAVEEGERTSTLEEMD